MKRNLILETLQNIVFSLSYEKKTCRYRGDFRCVSRHLRIPCQGRKRRYAAYLFENQCPTSSKRGQKRPVSDYDLIINDFEPVSAWACKLRQKPCIALSHQRPFYRPHVPRPKKKDALGKLILTKYGPSTTQYGFHFKAYYENLFTPIIRQEIRNTTRTTGNHCKRHTGFHKLTQLITV